MHIPVLAQHGTTSVCSTMGTLVIRHNNQTIRHKECLSDYTHANLISGQWIGRPKMLADNHKGLLQSKNGIKYTLDIDQRGGMCITHEESHADIKRANAIEQAKEMHERYGHISYNTLSTLLELPKIKDKPRCEACEEGKTTKPAARNYQKATISTSKLLEQIHADLVGPIKPTTS